jgi:hypothetical protein
MQSKTIAAVVVTLALLVGVTFGRYVVPEPQVPSDVNDGAAFVKSLHDAGLCGSVFIHDSGTVNVYAGYSCHLNELSGTGNSLPEAVASIKSRSKVIAEALGRTGR